MAGIRAVGQAQQNVEEQVDNLENYGIEDGPGVDDEETGVEEDVPHVIVPPVRCPLSLEELETLKAMENNMDTDRTGIDTYKAAFLFVAQCLSHN